MKQHTLQRRDVLIPQQAKPNCGMPMLSASSRFYFTLYLECDNRLKDFIRYCTCYWLHFSV